MGAPPRIWKMQFDISKLHGVPAIALTTEDNYQGGYASNPPDPFFFTIAYQSCNLTDTSSAEVTVMMEFDVKFQNLYTGESPS